jgi:hypothetical protein
MRVLVVLAVLAGSASANPQPWSVDFTYRGTASIATAGDKAPSAFVSSLVARIEHSTGRWFYGAVLGMGVPPRTGQSECSIAGGVRQTLRDGACIRGPQGTQLHCGPTLRLDYAMEMGVTMIASASEENRALPYYGPMIRPRVSFHATWPMRSGNQIGLTALVGLASVFASNAVVSDPMDERRATFRLEPSLELGGSIRF